MREKENSQTASRPSQTARVNKSFATQLVATAIGVLLGAALLCSVLSERVAYFLVGQFGVGQRSEDRCSLIFCSVLPTLFAILDERCGDSRPPLAKT